MAIDRRLIADSRCITKGESGKIPGKQKEDCELNKRLRAI